MTDTTQRVTDTGHARASRSPTAEGEASKVDSASAKVAPGRANAIFEAIRLMLLSFSALFAFVLAAVGFLGWSTYSDIGVTG